MFKKKLFCKVSILCCSVLLPSASQVVSLTMKPRRALLANAQKTDVSTSHSNLSIIFVLKLLNQLPSVIPHKTFKELTLCPFPPDALQCSPVHCAAGCQQAIGGDGCFFCRYILFILLFIEIHYKLIILSGKCIRNGKFLSQISLKTWELLNKEAS